MNMETIMLRRWKEVFESKKERNQLKVFPPWVNQFSTLLLGAYLFMSVCVSVAYFWIHFGTVQWNQETFKCEWGNSAKLKALMKPHIWNTCMSQFKQMKIMWQRQFVSE